MQTLKSSVRSLLHHLGFDVVRYRPIVPKPVYGTFPPHSEFLCIGREVNYFIHDGYQHRQQVSYFDDTPNSDGWQLEVYKFAREVADQFRLETICDIGCGSAHKLLTQFSDRRIIGVDVAKTCDWLRARYPEHRWIEADFAGTPPISPDLVIAADVIEHVLYPNELLSYIVRLRPKFIVLSTPERNLLCRGTHNGPPSNLAHIREWNFTELHAFLENFFEVREHFISNAGQATQCALCVPRA